MEKDDGHSGYCSEITERLTKNKALFLCALQTKTKTIVAHVGKKLYLCTCKWTTNPATQGRHPPDFPNNTNSAAPFRPLPETPRTRLKEIIDNLI